MVTRETVQPGRPTVQGRTEEYDSDVQVMLGGNQQLLRAIHQEAACSMLPVTCANAMEGTTFPEPDKRKGTHHRPQCRRHWPAEELTIGFTMA